jgi:RNA polymerase sigma-70 factor (ECF subfamily)
MQTTETGAAGEQKPQMSSNSANTRKFDEVLSRYLPSFQRMAFRKLGNAADAEDAVQDALLSAYKHLDQFRGGAQMSTWLTTIVINSARMQLRKRSNHVQESLDEPLDDEQQNCLSGRIADDSPNPEQVCRESELNERVRQFLSQMSAPLRKALQLRGVEGLTTHEAALILGVPDGTVKAQLTRARAKLRQLMRRSLNAKPSLLRMRTAVSVVMIEAENTRTRVTSTTRDHDRRALPRRRALRGESPASLAVGRRVA